MSGGGLQKINGRVGRRGVGYGREHFTEQVGSAFPRGKEPHFISEAEGASGNALGAACHLQGAV